MDKLYKVIEFDLKGGSLPQKGDKFDAALKKAQKNAIVDFENLLNKNCTVENEWRFESISTIPFYWGGQEYHKSILILKKLVSLPKQNE